MADGVEASEYWDRSDLPESEYGALSVDDFERRLQGVCTTIGSSPSSSNYSTESIMNNINQVSAVLETLSKDDVVQWQERCKQLLLYRYMPPIVHALLSPDRSGEPELMAPIFEAVTRSLVLSVQQLPNHIEANVQALMVALDPHMTFYSIDDDAEDDSSDDARDGDGNATSHPSAIQARGRDAHRRSELMSASHVDVRVGKKWQGCVVKDHVAGQLQVQVELAGRINEVWLDLDSSRLAPLGRYSNTMLQEQPFRQSLSRGANVDALDTVSKWYTARVLQLNDERTHVLISYDGWSSKYDEWLPITSGRLAAPLSRARGGKESGGTIFGTRDDVCEVADDGDDENVCAVYRSPQFGSHRYVAVVNRFEELGGFRAVLKAIPDAPVTQLTLLVRLFHNVTCVLSRKFAQACLPQFRNVVFRRVLGLNDIELRTLSKRTVTDLVRTLQFVLTRIFPLDEVKLVLERFQLDVALLRLRSPIVERQLNGIDYLLTVITSFSRGRFLPSSQEPSSSTPSSKFVDWMDKHKVLELAFAPTAHPQLMKRASEIVCFMCLEARLNVHHLDVVWRALERSLRFRNDGTFAILYGVFDEVATLLSEDHIEHLLERVGSLPIDAYVPETLDLVHRLYLQLIRELEPSHPSHPGSLHHFYVAKLTI